MAEKPKDDAPPPSLSEAIKSGKVKEFTGTVKAPVTPAAVDPLAGLNFIDKETAAKKKTSDDISVTPPSPKSEEKKAYDTAFAPAFLSGAAPERKPITIDYSAPKPLSSFEGKLAPTVESVKPVIPPKPKIIMPKTADPSGKKTSSEILAMLKVNPDALKPTAAAPSAPEPVKANSAPEVDAPPPLMSQRTTASKTEPEVHSTTPTLKRR
jgi:hypothetical protein